MVGSAKNLLKDPTAWEHYKFERDLGEYKRLAGRPRMKPEERKSPKGKIKRSDQMKKLLSDHSIIVNRDNTLEPVSAYTGWVFLPNGRIRFEDEASISAHSFLRDYC